MKVLRLALALALVGCLKGPSVPAQGAELNDHAAACTAAGDVVKAVSELKAEPCWLTELRLTELVRTNDDCKAYWGDAGVDLRCAPEPPPAWLDGGVDGSD